MLISLRRIYLYAVAAVALIATTLVVQNFFHALLQRAGMLDYPYQVDNLLSLPQASAFLAVALVIFVPLGALHYWFIRREDPSSLGGVVRVIFLDLVTIIAGIVTVTALASTGYNLFSTHYTSSIGVGPSLATSLAWGIALALVIIERQRTGQQLPAARGITLTLGYLTQFGLLIGLVVYTSFAIQTILDTVIQAAPKCDYRQGSFSYTGCQVAPYSDVGSVVAVVAVLLLGMAGYMVWTWRDTGSIYRQVAEGLFLIVGAIAAIVGIDNLAQLVLNLATSQPDVTFPLAMVSHYGRTFNFLGPLVGGGGTVAFFLVSAFRAPGNSVHPRQGRQIATVSLAFPLAAVFLSGLAIVVNGLLQIARGHTYDIQSWFSGESLIVAGVAWIALWPLLARMSDPRGEGPTVPRRLYVLVLLGTTLLGTAISLAVALYYTISSLIGSPVDATGNTSTTSFAVALVLGATAGYYIVVLQRDQRVLKQRTGASITPAQIAEAAELAHHLEVPTTLEAVLQQVAAHQVPVDAAASLLRERFGAR